MAKEVRMFIAPTEQQAKIEEGVLEQSGWNFIRRTMQADKEVTAVVQGNPTGAIAERNVWLFIAERDR
jgi:hypothetical protein